MRSKTNSRFSHYLIAGVLTVLIVILSFIFFVLYQYCGSVKIAADYVIGSTSSFNLDTDKMHFGMVLPGGFAEREITIHSACASNVHIYYRQLPHISGPETPLFIPKGNYTLTFTVQPPFDAQHNTYEGEILLLFERV